MLVCPITDGLPRFIALTCLCHRQKSFWTFKKWHGNHAYSFLIQIVLENKFQKKNPLLSWVQILQIFSVCPGVKSRTTRMRSGNWCILLDCMTRNAMKWSFYWGSCNHRRMPSIRFLQLAGYWTTSISLLQLSLMLFVNERNEAIFISEKGNFYVFDFFRAL